MVDLHDKIDELAELMTEYGLSDATLSGNGWKVQFGRDLPQRGLIGMAPTVAPDSAPTPASNPAPKAAPIPKGTPITTPMMGVFYSSPSPGAPPFVNEGDTVTAGQVVGLIEAMKVFNEITSAVSGTVVAVVAKSGDLVQPGDTLVLIQ